MNILVGVNTAKVFGGSLAMGGVMAGIFQPAAGADHLFGEALQPGGRGDRRAAGGHSDVLDREKAARGSAWLDRAYSQPLLTTLITGSVAIVALQPLGGWISEAIAHGASLAIDRGGLLVGSGAVRYLPAAGADRPAPGAGCRSTSSLCRRTAITRCCLSVDGGEWGRSARRLPY